MSLSEFDRSVTDEDSVKYVGKEDGDARFVHSSQLGVSSKCTFSLMKCIGSSAERDAKLPIVRDPPATSSNGTLSQSTAMLDASTQIFTPSCIPKAP